MDYPDRYRQSVSISDPAADQVSSADILFASFTLEYRRLDFMLCETGGEPVCGQKFLLSLRKKFNS